MKTEDLGLVINFGTGVMEIWLCVKKNSRKKDQTGGRGGPRGVWQKATLFPDFFPGILPLAKVKKFYTNFPTYIIKCTEQNTKKQT